jgi:hypothetical protein
MSVPAVPPLGRCLTSETLAAVPPWYVPDTEGTDLRPDPDAVTTPAGLLRAIRMYHTWSGNPSAQTLAKRCRHRVSAAQFGLILNGQGRLTLPVLRDLVAACGTTPEYWRRFERAWRRVAGEAGRE